MINVLINSNAWNNAFLEKYFCLLLGLQGGILPYKALI